MPTSLRSWIVGCLSLALCAGCGKCGPGGNGVPFKRGEKPAENVAANLPQPAPGEVQGRAGDSFPSGTARVEIDGRALELKDASVRAALVRQAPSQTDPKTEARALILTETPGGELAFAEVHASDKLWSAPENPSVLLNAGSRGCTLAQAAVRELDANYSVLEAELECTAPSSIPEPDPSGAPALPAPAPSSAPAPAANPEAAPKPAIVRREQHRFVLATDPAPRVLEHFVLRSEPQANELPLGLALESHDYDEDGSPDLGLAFTLGEGERAARVVVRWFNRAGGLAHDTSEPEATVLALADKAKTERKARPALAFELAQRALAIHAALCAESGRARVFVDDARGLDCGPSLGAGRAASIVTAVYASQGKLLAALALYRELSQPAYRLIDNDWERARFALHQKLDDKSYAFVEGPAPELATGPRIHHAPVAFLDEQHLVLFGASPRVYDVGARTTEPSGIPAESAILDPSGQLALSEIMRACDGYHLRIVQRTQLNAGVVSGPPLAAPLVLRADPPPGAHCPELSRAQATDDGGLTAIEWTAQGVVLARGEQLLLFPLELPFTTAPEARTLSDADPVPALGRSFALSADGRFHALGTPIGVAVHDRKTGETRLIAPPDGEGAIDAVAISQSGQNLALVRGGKLWIGTPRATGNAAAAPPPTPAREPPPAPSPPDPNAPPPRL